MVFKGLTITLSSKLQNILDPTKKVIRPRGDAFEHWGNHIPKGLIREAPARVLVP